MKASVSQSGDVTVVHVSGYINYETVDPFRENCLRTLRQKKIVFNLTGLSFVGSRGIGQFVRTLGELAATSPDGLKVCMASSEFQKVLVSREIPGLEIFEDQFQAERAFIAPPAPPLQT